MEIEFRFLFCGFYVIGQFLSVEEAIVILVNIVSLDWEDEGIWVLFILIVESIGCNMEEIYCNSDKGILVDVELL